MYAMPKMEKLHVICVTNSASHAIKFYLVKNVEQGFLTEHHESRLEQMLNRASVEITTEILDIFQFINIYDYELGSTYQTYTFSGDAQ